MESKFKKPDNQQFHQHTFPINDGIFSVFDCFLIIFEVTSSTICETCQDSKIFRLKKNCHMGTPAHILTSKKISMIFWI